MSWGPGSDREWRGRPPVPGLRFDRRNAVSRRGAARLPAACIVALGLYMTLDPFLTRVLGGVWGVLAGVLLTGAPVGAAWAMAERGEAGLRAWKTGLLFAFASAAVYAWIFTGAWV